MEGLLHNCAKVRVTDERTDGMKVYRTELTPVSFLYRSAYVFPHKTAVVHGDRRYSYQQFAERVNRLATRLRAGGLQKHDRVAFLSPNIPPLLEASFAVPAAGGIFVAINIRFSARGNRHIPPHPAARIPLFD